MTSLFSVRQEFQQTGTRELKRCTQVHHQYVGGAIAELVDNAREAKATRLDIDVEDATLYFTDNGTGMKPKELSTMLSFGFTTKGSDAQSTNNFGIGFKSGSMTIGNEALVFTNDGNVRGLAFLSKGLNPQGAGILLRVPFVWWHADGQPATNSNPLPASPSRAQDTQEPIQSNQEVLTILSDVFQARNTPIRTFQQIRTEFENLDAFSQQHPNDAKPHAQVGGTRVIIFALPLSGPQSLRFPQEGGEDGDEQHDIIIRRGHDPLEDEGDATVPFTRQDRSPPFLRGVDVPIDYSVRRYLEVLYMPECAMEINLLGKPIRHVDLLDKRYVLNQRRYAFELPALTDSPGYSEKRVGLEVVFGFSPEDYESRRFGLFVYWDTNPPTARRQGGSIAPRLVLPYHRVGDQEAASARALTQADFRGVIGVVAVTPRVLRVDNGKQKFDQSAADADIGNLADNYRQCMDTLGDLLREYIRDEMEKNAAVLAQQTDMFARRLHWNCPCWARFAPTQWWPSQLLNRYDRTLGSDEAKTAKEAQNHELHLVLYEAERESQAYGWLKLDCLRPFDPNADPNPRPIKDARFKQAMKLATKKQGEVVGEEEEHLAECRKCLQVRLYRGAPYTTAYECGMGWFAPPSLTRLTLCDPVAAPETPADRAKFYQEKNLGRGVLNGPSTDSHAGQDDKMAGGVAAKSEVRGEVVRSGGDAVPSHLVKGHSVNGHGVKSQVGAKSRDPKKGGGVKSPRAAESVRKISVLADASHQAAKQDAEVSQLDEVDISALLGGARTPVASGGGTKVYAVKRDGERLAAKVWEGLSARAEVVVRFERMLAAQERVGKNRYCVSVLGKQTRQTPLGVLTARCKCSLQEALRSDGGGLSVLQWLLVALQVARAMRSAAKKGVTHGGLSLRNVLLQWDAEDGYQARVSDFGAWALAGQARPPPSMYAAPELLDPSRPAAPSEASDVVAFGWVLLQAAAGRESSWAAMQAGDVALEIRSRQRDQHLLAAARERCQPAADLAASCLHDEPLQRPNFEAIEERLVSIVETTPMLAGTPPPDWRAGQQGSRVVFRVLDDSQVKSVALGNGIRGSWPQRKVRKCGLEAVQASLNLDFHVAGGQECDGRSVFHSCSGAREWVLWYVQKKHWLARRTPRRLSARSTKYGAYPWVAIDLDRLPAESRVIDLSSRQQLDKCPEASRLSQLARCHAASAQEVILLGDIPQHAIVDGFEVDPNSECGKAFLETGLEEQEACLEWKPARQTDKFEPFLTWRVRFRDSEAGQDLDAFWEGCKDTAGRNRTWPVPRGFEMPTAAKGGGEKAGGGERKKEGAGGEGGGAGSGIKRQRSDTDADDDKPTAGQFKKGRLGGMGSLSSTGTATSQGSGRVNLKVSPQSKATVSPQTDTARGEEGSGRKEYTCSVCGEPKKGHVCKARPPAGA